MHTESFQIAQKGEKLLKVAFIKKVWKNFWFWVPLLSYVQTFVGFFHFSKDLSKNLKSSFWETLKATQKVEFFGPQYETKN